MRHPHLASAQLGQPFTHQHKQRHNLLNVSQLRKTGAERQTVVVTFIFHRHFQIFIISLCWQVYYVRNEYSKCIDFELIFGYKNHKM